MPAIQQTYIVKVQVALASNASPPWPALIYAQNRTFIRQQNLPKKVWDVLNGDLKGYFKATFDHDKDSWDFGERVKDQPW
jgi:hypothetical protein